MLPLVKQEKVEREDCNLDLKVEVNIRAECGLSTGECGFVHESVRVSSILHMVPMVTLVLIQVKQNMKIH